mmetsp:Transcript_82696/g.151605  ORF Transcript_82696/g.151605 Transcript_82696/m.151605 type:complete len:329 (-) Transcript_82696:270-1256(-)
MASCVVCNDSLRLLDEVCPLCEGSPAFLQECYVLQPTAFVEVRDCKKANGVYERHREAYNGKPVWKRREGLPCYIFYNLAKQAWFINKELANKSGYASLSSTAEVPPLGRWDRSGSAMLVALGYEAQDAKRDAVPSEAMPVWRHAGQVAGSRKAGDLLVFVRAGRGRLAARGAPGDGAIARWCSEVGPMYVVTLLREDEPAFRVVQPQVRQLEADGTIRGWLHLPLSGGSCITMRTPSEQDVQSLANVNKIVELLRGGASVVVHCAAGLHRTGIVCYATLRLLGQSPEEALESILLSRPKTHAEITKATKKHIPLCELAEQRVVQSSA